MNIAEFFTLGGVELQPPAMFLSESLLWRRGAALGVKLCRFRIDIFSPRIGRSLSFPRFTFFSALPIVFPTSMLHSSGILCISKLFSVLVLTISTGWLDGAKLWILLAGRQVGRRPVPILVQHASVLVSGLEVKHINQLYSGRILPDRSAWFNVVHQPTMENSAFTL